MHRDPSTSTTVRIPKLTERAKTALATHEESSRKRKNDGNQEAILKKARSDPQTATDKTWNSIVSQVSKRNPPPRPRLSMSWIVSDSDEDDTRVNDTGTQNGARTARAANSARESSVVEIESPEEELKRLMKGWNSPVYGFFDPKPQVIEVDSRRVHEFKCSARGCKVRRFLDTKGATSTSNLRRHAKSCRGQEALNAADDAKDVDEVRRKHAPNILKDGPITVTTKGKGKGKASDSHNQHTRVETRVEIVRWISESLRPFSVINDRGFRSLMKTGRSEDYLPSPSTVSRDVRVVFARTRNRVAKMLREYGGKLNFTTDTWTPDHRAFVAFSVHLEHEGKPLSIPLDIVKVARSHSGVEMATVFANMLEEFGVSDKILAVTCDNASHNDDMINELSRLAPTFAGSASRTRCFLHVVNLIAKSLLSQFDGPKQGAHLEDGEVAELCEKLEEEETILVNLHRAGCEDDGGVVEDDNSDGWVDEREHLTDGKKRELKRTVRPVRLALTKLRKLAFEIVNSTAIVLPEWRRILEELRKAVTLMPRDVRTRWNSTFDMLEYALTHRKAIDTITQGRELGLRKFELSDNEWAVVEQLHGVLKILKDATLFFSRSTPNLATVIPAMDHIDRQLTTYSINRKYLPSIRAAVSLAKRTLNRYYSLTDDAEVYRIAMVLHPRHKLAYFKNMHWEDEWVKTVEDLVREEYARSYAAAADGGDTMGIDGSVDHSESTCKGTNIFDNLAALAPPEPKDLGPELDRYLSSDVEHVTDPIAWWTKQRAMFPNLSRMALDYLTIPATLSGIERLFSRSRLLFSHVSRLSAQSTRALLCLNIWYELNLVKEMDVLRVCELPEVRGDEQPLEDGWDRIVLE